MKITLNKSRILSNKKVTDNYFLMKFENRNTDQPRACQFINLRINDRLDPFLRRPFAVFDFNKKYISILYKVIGKTTRILSLLKKDDIIEYLGFLGTSFKPDFKKRNIWVVAGGIGIGGVHLFLKQVKASNNVEMFMGFNSTGEAEDFLKFFKIKNIKISLAVLERNKKNFCGNVVELLKNQESVADIIFACGPKLMLENLYRDFIQEHKITAYFSMESIMACGIGSCMGCNIKIKEGNSIKHKRVCKDGPVFKANQIIW